MLRHYLFANTFLSTDCKQHDLDFDICIMFLKRTKLSYAFVIDHTSHINKDNASQTYKSITTKILIKCSFSIE